jgi:hypothetical protein
MLVAAIALVFALTGGAVAAQHSAKPVTKSSAKSIAKKQADKQLKANVSGSHVNLADSATNATNATNAGNASTVGGVGAAEINFQVPSNTPETTIFSGGGLVITGECDNLADIALRATTTKENSSIYSSGVFTDNDTNNHNDDLESGDFDVVSDYDLLDGTAGNPLFLTFEYDALDGSIVTGTIAADEDVSSCKATGHVFVS